MSERCEELRHGGEYNNIVPTTEHIEMALKNHVRFWRTAQGWSEQAPEELARFDREYYGRLSQLQAGHFTERRPRNA